MDCCAHKTSFRGQLIEGLDAGGEGAGGGEFQAQLGQFLQFSVTTRDDSHAELPVIRHALLFPQPGHLASTTTWTRAGCPCYGEGSLPLRSYFVRYSSLGFGASTDAGADSFIQGKTNGATVDTTT